MKKVVLVLCALALAACDFTRVTLHSAIEEARDGNFNEAISQYQELITNTPNKPLYYNNLGWAFFRNGQFSEARDSVQKASELDANRKLADAIELNLNMITEYENARNTICTDLTDQTGIAYFTNEKEFEVHFRYSANEIGYLLLGECYQRLGDLEKANIAYKKLLTLFKGKSFDSVLKSKASLMLENG